MRRPSESDTKRAALCCLAIKQDRQQDVERLFEKFRHLNFRKVILTPFTRRVGKNDPEKLLFASAVDIDVSDKTVVYVAFKGNPSLVDILHGTHKGNLSLLDRSQEASSYRNQACYFQESFYERLMSSVPSVDRILQYVQQLAMDSAASSSSHVSSSLLQSGLKVFFCGHGSGGAISHMAVLTYLLSLSSLVHRSLDTINFSLKDILENDDSLISISFGTPSFCDQDTTAHLKSVLGDTLLQTRFFNFVAEDDPVPFLLLDRPSQEAKEKHHTCSYKKVRVKFSKSLGDPGFLLDSLDLKATDRDSGLDESSRKELAYLYEELSRISGSKPYGLFGSYLDVSSGIASGSSSATFGGFERLWRQRRSEFGHVGRWEAHAMSNYLKALGYDGQENSPAHSSVPTIAVGEPPQLINASLVILRGRGRVGQLTDSMARIEATGSNLSLLLVKNCSISTLHEDRWAIVAGDEKTVTWESSGPLAENELQEFRNSGRGSPATKIKVETAFGSAESFTEVRLKDSTAGSFAVDGLKHALGKLAILADTDLDGPGSIREIRESLGVVAQFSGIDGTSVKNVDVILESRTRTPIGKKKALDEGIFSWICEELCEKPLVVDFESNENLTTLAKWTDSQYLMGIVQTVLSFVDPISSIVAMVVLFGAKWIVLLIQYLSRRKSIELRTYEEIIKFLYAQIFLETNEGSADQEPASNLEALSIRFCEQKIHRYVENVDSGSIPFSSDLKCKDKARERMEARIRLVHSVQETYYQAKRKKVLAIVGTQNAGKTTLINLLRRHYYEQGVPDIETGFCAHTSEVKGYCIGENKIAVDFPGVDGANVTWSEMWKAFEKMPDLCVVMVKFSGDVDSTCESLRRTFAEKFCQHYILLVNHVDSVMRGKSGSKVWNEYSLEAVQKLRERYRLGAFGKKDVVHLCCLNDEDLHEFERKQLEDRSILFGADVARTILELLDVGYTDLDETF